MAFGGTRAVGGIDVSGIRADGWIAELLAQLEGHTSFAELAGPVGFQGTLRPYQLRGFSWLAFLRRWGLGACLADDMGLGKTIQVLTLIQREWEAGARAGASDLAHVRYRQLAKGGRAVHAGTAGARASRHRTQEGPGVRQGRLSECTRRLELCVACA